MEKCKNIKRLLPFYVVNEIDDNDKQRVEEHLAQCESCKKEVAIQQQILIKRNVFSSERVDLQKQRVLINEKIDKKLKKSWVFLYDFKVAVVAVLSVVVLILSILLIKNNESVRDEMTPKVISSIDFYKELDLYENFDFFENTEI